VKVLIKAEDNIDHVCLDYEIQKHAAKILQPG